MKPLMLLWLMLGFCGISNAQTGESTPRPVVVSAQLMNGKLIYRVNGKIVESSARNSLMTNVSRVLGTRGKETPVFIVIDVRAPFRQFEHIDTALDKVDLPNRRYFVSNFTNDHMMTEIHWADKAVPIPQNTGKE